MGRMKRGAGRSPRFTPVSDYAREVARRRRKRERRGLTAEEMARREHYAERDRDKERKQLAQGNRGDAVCHGCGLIYSGPDTGVTLADEAPADLTSEEGMAAAGLNGSHINHGGFCPDCRLSEHEIVAEANERRYGPDWRQRIIEAGYDPDEFGMATP